MFDKMVFDPSLTTLAIQFQLKVSFRKVCGYIFYAKAARSVSGSRV